MKFQFQVFFFILATGLCSFQAQADECSFIREALHDLPEAGGVIKIPAGTYNCEAPIVISRSHVKLRGEGASKVTFRLADHRHAPLIVIGEPRIIKDQNGNFVTAHRVSDIQVADLTLDGNRENHDVTKECGENICEGDPSGVRNNGITIRGANDIVVENVVAHSMISGGLVTEKYCHHLIVRNFESYNNYFDGFAGYQTEQSEFSNLYLHHNRGAGISIDIDFNNNLMRDSRLYDNDKVGIFARNLFGNRFVRLSIQRSGSYNVFAAAAEAPNSCAHDNTFDSVLINGSALSGFRVNDNCPGNKIIGTSNLCGNKTGAISEDVAGTVLVGADVSCR